MKKKKVRCDPSRYLFGVVLDGRWHGGLPIRWLSVDEYEPDEGGVYPVIQEGERRLALFSSFAIGGWEGRGITDFLPVKLPAVPERKCNKPITCTLTEGHDGECG